MITPRIIVLLIVFTIVSSSAMGATIVSTGFGGLWSEDSTWIGGIIPGGDDHVVIDGPVFIEGFMNCASLGVKSTGILAGATVAGTPTLAVSGDVHNSGSIDNGSYHLALEIGGSLHNAGSWTNFSTTITGTDERNISQDDGFEYVTNLQFDDTAAGDLIATTALSINGDTVVTGGRLVLQADCPFTLDDGVFNGLLAANGNEMRFEGWAYLHSCTLDDVILVGDLEAAHLVNFTTRVVVMGHVQNGTGGGGAIVHGDLINYGLISNINYGFLLQIHGNLENYGTITIPLVEFVGADVEHHISMSEDALITSPIYLPEFQAATLIADTPVQFASGLNLGIGTLILSPGSSLEFTGFGGFSHGTILANGNEIRINGTGALSTLTIDQGVIAGPVALHNDCIFTNGLTVTGVITNWPFASANVEVHGLLENRGIVEDDAHPVHVVAHGDVQNMGVFSNTSLTLAGVQDQAIGVGMDMLVETFVIESGLAGPGFQWYHNGAELIGEMNTSLMFENVGPAMYGEYHCVANGQTSRMITVNETLGTSGVPGLGTVVQLEQNFPNPFNPMTEIAFSLEQEGQVSLVVYDIAGREVHRLVDGTMNAGRHSITWQPKDIASGTYFYGLHAGGHRMVKKCVLLK